MSALAVVEAQTPEARLDELIEIINAEHGHSMAFLAKALQHAINCGNALLEAKSIVPHGGWTRWLEQNVDVHHSTANMYMRIAAFSDMLAEQKIATIKAAQAYLTSNNLRLTLMPDQKDQMRALRDRGLSYQQIADVMGVAHSTVRMHLTDPEWGSRPRRVPDEARAARWPRRQIEIEDDMIERAADWLAAYLRRHGHPQNVTDTVRNDAVELLGTALNPQET